MCNLLASSAEQAISQEGSCKSFFSLIAVHCMRSADHCQGTSMFRLNNPARFCCDLGCCPGKAPLLIAVCVGPTAYFVLGRGPLSSTGARPCNAFSVLYDIGKAIAHISMDTNTYKPISCGGKGGSVLLA